MKEIKQELYNHCKAAIEKSIADIERAIAERREAVHNETKSSMGDKYETTREMLQQDINMNMERLSKVRIDEAALTKIDPERRSASITDGSVVHTNNGNFYIAIGLGKIKFVDTLYYAISPSSPMGIQLKGKKVKDSFLLNGKQYEITEVI